MGWISSGPCFTVDELVKRGVPVDEACWIAWDQAPVPASMKEESDDQHR